MKHFYQTIAGQFTWPKFTAFVVARFASSDRKYRPARFVELGILHGQSAACIGVELINAAEKCENAQLILIDAYLCPDLVDTLAPVASVLGPMRQGISWEQAAQFEDGSLDYVMIDAAHDYESVKKDIAAWLPKVRPGGILAGHDYTPEIPGVIQAVTEALEDIHVHNGERFCGTLGDQPPGNYYPVWWIEIGQ